MNSKNYKRCNKKIKTRKFKGGYGKGSGPVGYPWKSNNISTWPGVKGIDNMSNHLDISKYGIPSGPFDPPISTTGMIVKRGGKKTKKKTKKKPNKKTNKKTKKKPNKKTNKKRKGGGLIPQDLINIGRSVSYGIQNIASNYSSNSSIPVNPLPTEQTTISQSYKIIPTGVSNIPSIIQNAIKNVSKI
jgi:hypothetical protein